MKDIPENVLWLLAFANLGCKAGQIRQWDVSDQNPPVKRPPVEPPSDLNKKFPDVENFIYSVRNKDAWIDHCWERDVKAKNLKYLGQGEGNPTFKESTDFFFNPENEKILKLNTEPTKCPVRVFVESCRGILPAPPIPDMLCRDNVRKYFITLWKSVRSILLNKGDSSVKGTYEISKADTRLQNHPIPKTIYNALFDFLLISSGGLFQVKQCACCGRLHTGKSKYCHTKCKIRFNYSTTKNNRKSVTNARKRSKPSHQKKDYYKICDVYIKNSYPQKYAEEAAHKWVYVDKKTYKQFERKERSFRGEGLL